MNNFVLLDRDGVINYDSDTYIKTPDEFNIIPSSLEAIQLLYNAGFKIIVITNQSGLNRGYFSQSSLNAIHQKLHSVVESVGAKIEHIYICPHTPDENCACRKPKATLILQAIDDYNINTKDLYFIGDKLADIDSGQNAGINSALVLTGKGQKTIKKHQLEIEGKAKIFSTLLDFSAFILTPMEV
ncbi:MAG: D-glycero-beta-D-manno-heptose 1,7-bisphosphate 7-phosphatase [Francisellaceae bacterium]|nr:D-glycero-beta-D-manno-heptose 1,7-bisphosphate 7-phosphatase [Francisellaceae bacterium]